MLCLNYLKIFTPNKKIIKTGKNIKTTINKDFI